MKTNSAGIVFVIVNQAPALDKLHVETKNIKQSSITTQKSSVNHPSIISQSLCVIHHSSFVIRHSSFIIHHSSFVIRHSPFIIHHSSFIIVYHQPSVIDRFSSCVVSSRVLPSAFFPAASPCSFQCAAQSCNPPQPTNSN